MFSCCHKSTKGRNAFINWQLDRICKMRVGLCFFLFTYITYALIFFFMVPKMKENFDIWDARKLRSYFCWLELSWCLGIWKKKNNQGIIFCFKMMSEVFQHFTRSSCPSCGICLSSLCFWYWYTFSWLHHVYLKWYWTLISSHAGFSVLLGNVGHLALDQIQFIYVNILGTLGHDCRLLTRHKRQTKWTLQN